MRKVLLVTVSLLVTLIPGATSQTPEGNPFKHLGYNASAYTFGVGKEFHDRETVVIIGNALFDTQKNEVIGFIDNPDSLIGLRPELQSMSIDPHCEKYVSVSPYVFCLNNPVRLIDPDGRDVWEINQRGEIVRRIEDTTQDAFYVLNKDGQRMTNADGSERTVSFEYNTVEHQARKDTKGNKYDLFQLKGDDKGTQLFEFLADNTTSSSIEWGHIKTGAKGENGLNFITTSHTENVEHGASDLFHTQLRHGYTIREMNHSHPQVAYSDIPSGLLKRETGDIGFASDITNAMLAKKRTVPLFQIYSTSTQGYTPFKSTSTTETFLLKLRGLRYK